MGLGLDSCKGLARTEKDSCSGQVRSGPTRHVAKARDGETGNVAMVGREGTGWERCGELQRGGAMGRVLVGCNG